ncbi:acyl-CoA-binding domain-containing protein [Aquimarina intermedia]|uniref:Acyl-CoA-binding protein n=1 Tax=Aquimarina intermedia TaxID=350814 RepID=A0A5S5C392_9FLAO|nr:acyl-CoA-binding protein [Aquimarina intermedia]TYP73609.1 acyl-CoA-binding protein [Aquimarina intermedia]
MNDEDLDIAFEKAFTKASNTKLKLPTDIMLHLYAHYKLATHTKGFYTPSGTSELRNAFKLNALFQVKHLSQKEAKLKYIALVDQYITDMK